MKGIRTITIIIENVKTGDVFPTETKLLTTVGFKKPTDSKTKKYQIRELQRYLSYEKTGKTSRGKVTNEIVITEIYDEPEEKEDNRCNNGSSVISNKIHDYIVSNLEYSYLPVVGSKSSIIRQVGLLDSDFCDCYYNFDENPFFHVVDEEEVPYSAVEKEFFFDYCDKVMGSYKNRLQRVLDNMGDAITIEKCYQTSKLTMSKYGNEYYATEEILDDETIAKINKIKEDVEFTYGVVEKNEKWKIYSSRSKAKKFHEDFIGQVKTLLNDETIKNCYEILYVTRNEDSEEELEHKYDGDSEKLNIAQSKFAEDKILSTLKMTYSVYDGRRMEFVKMPKYNAEDISDDTIKDCMEMVNRSIDMTIDENTGEVFFSNEVLERLSAPTSEFRPKTVDNISSDEWRNITDSEGWGSANPMNIRRGA